MAGSTFLVWFGPTVRLTVSDPDLIREIFTSKQSEFYEKSESHPLVKQLEGDGLLSLKGEKWAHHRKIILPTFYMENLKVKHPSQESYKKISITSRNKHSISQCRSIDLLSFFANFFFCVQLLVPVVASSVTSMLEKWEALMSKSGEVEIEVSEWLQNLTEDIITRTAFGISYEDGKAIFRLQAQQMVLAADVFQKVFIPGYR